MVMKKILVLVFEMLVRMIEVILLLIIALLIVLVLRGGKRPPFIPLPSDFSAIANFGTNL